MNDLDTLRPEVRNAVVGADKAFDHTGLFPEPYWQTIRAELLRLAKENADLLSTIDLDEQVWVQRDETMHRWIERVMNAEAELAAIKARISASPVYEIPVTKPRTETGWAGVVESVKNLDALRGKRVRLIAEE